MNKHILRVDYYSIRFWFNILFSSILSHVIFSSIEIKQKKYLVKRTNSVKLDDIYLLSLFFFACPNNKSNFFLEINWNIQTIKRNISKTSFIFPKNKSKLEDFIKTIEINLNCILFLDFLSTRWSFNTSSVCIFHDIIKLIAVKTDKDLSKNIFFVFLMNICKYWVRKFFYCTLKRLSVIPYWLLRRTSG